MSQDAQRAAPQVRRGPVLHNPKAFQSPLLTARIESADIRDTSAMAPGSSLVRNLAQGLVNAIGSALRWAGSGVLRAALQAPGVLWRLLLRLLQAALSSGPGRAVVAALAGVCALKWHFPSGFFSLGSQQRKASATVSLSLFWDFIRIQSHFDVALPRRGLPAADNSPESSTGAHSSIDIATGATAASTVQGAPATATAEPYLSVSRTSAGGAGGGANTHEIRVMCSQELTDSIIRFLQQQQQQGQSAASQPDGPSAAPTFALHSPTQDGRVGDSTHLVLTTLRSSHPQAQPPHQQVQQQADMQPPSNNSVTTGLSPAVPAAVPAATAATSAAPANTQQQPRGRSRGHSTRLSARYNGCKGSNGSAGCMSDDEAVGKLPTAATDQPQPGSCAGGSRPGTEATHSRSGSITGLHGAGGSRGGSEGAGVGAVGLRESVTTATQPPPPGVSAAAWRSGTSGGAADTPAVGPAARDASADVSLMESAALQYARRMAAQAPVRPADDSVGAANAPASTSPAYLRANAAAPPPPSALWPLGTVSASLDQALAPPRRVSHDTHSPRGTAAAANAVPQGAVHAPRCALQASLQSSGVVFLPGAAETAAAAAVYRAARWRPSGNAAARRGSGGSTTLQPRASWGAGSDGGGSGGSAGASERAEHATQATQHPVASLQTDSDTSLGHIKSAAPHPSHISAPLQPNVAQQQQQGVAAMEGGVQAASQQQGSLQHTQHGDSSQHSTRSTGGSEGEGDAAAHVQSAPTSQGSDKSAGAKLMLPHEQERQPGLVDTQHVGHKGRAVGGLTCEIEPAELTTGTQEAAAAAASPPSPPATAVSAWGGARSAGASPATAAAQALPRVGFSAGRASRSSGARGVRAGAWEAVGRSWSSPQDAAARGARRGGSAELGSPWPSRKSGSVPPPGMGVYDTDPDAALEAPLRALDMWNSLWGLQ